jgi:RsiW-degrading membrane proteinase PrsW (M82 family)
MTYHKMKNILISLDSIVSEINTYNNDLWSKYLMIVLILVILVVDLVFFEVFFKKKKKMNFFFKMILFYCSSTAFLILIIVINTASSASFEANKSYKQLNKLFTVDNKQLSIRIRIKV